MLNPMLGMPQGSEWIYILLIVIIVFGAAKLPELARSTGQALKIFKNETKGLVDGDDDEKAAAPSQPAPTVTQELPPAPASPSAPGATGPTPAGTETTTGTTTGAAPQSERHPG